jgi:dephospho-CoA kinase
MLIGQAVVVCGKICSGKSTASRIIGAQLGFDRVSFGELIRRHATASGLDITRVNLQDVGWDLLCSLGPSGILEAAISSSNPSQHGKVLFDGVRNMLVLLEVRAISARLLTVYMRAEDSIRFHRYLNRSATDPNLTFEEFMKINNHPIELGIEPMAACADVITDTSVSDRPDCHEVTEHLLASKRLRF